MCLSEGVMMGRENGAEICRLHRAEEMPIKAIARRLVLSENSVRGALASTACPSSESLEFVNTIQTSSTPTENNGLDKCSRGQVRHRQVHVHFGVIHERDRPRTHYTPSPLWIVTQSPHTAPRYHLGEVEEIMGRGERVR